MEVRDTGLSQFLEVHHGRRAGLGECQVFAPVGYRG